MDPPAGCGSPRPQRSPEGPQLRRLQPGPAHTERRGAGPTRLASPLRVCSVHSAAARDRAARLTWRPGSPPRGSPTHLRRRRPPAPPTTSTAAQSRRARISSARRRARLGSVLRPTAKAAPAAAFPGAGGGRGGWDATGGPWTGAPSSGLSGPPPQGGKWETAALSAAATQPARIALRVCEARLGPQGGRGRILRGHPGPRVRISLLVCSESQEPVSLSSETPTRLSFPRVPHLPSVP